MGLFPVLHRWSASASASFCFAPLFRTLVVASRQAVLRTHVVLVATFPASDHSPACRALPALHGFVASPRPSLSRRRTRWRGWPTKLPSAVAHWTSVFTLQHRHSQEPPPTASGIESCSSCRLLQNPFCGRSAPALESKDREVADFFDK